MSYSDRGPEAAPIANELAPRLHEADQPGRKKSERKRAQAESQQQLSIIADDPYQNPPPFEKLVGDLTGACSRRINIQHRLVYQVFNEDRVVKVLRMWSHYE